MTETTEEDAAKTAAKQVALEQLRAWNDRWKRQSVPVYVTGGDGRRFITFTSGLAYLAERDSAVPFAAVGLRGSWEGCSLSRLTVHERAGELDGLTAPRGEDAMWRHPDCPECYRELSGDGDSLWCENCPISWSANGDFSTRLCVEDCGSDAEVIGDDDQPRCKSCHFQILLGVIEATAPYRCTTCKDTVTGTLSSSDAFRWELCPSCAAGRRENARRPHSVSTTDAL